MRAAFSVVLFPQFMAYAFVIKLNDDQTDMRLVWDRAPYLYVTWYVFLVAIVIAAVALAILSVVTFQVPGELSGFFN